MRAWSCCRLISGAAASRSRSAELSSGRSSHRLVSVQWLTEKAEPPGEDAARGFSLSRPSSANAAMTDNAWEIAHPNDEAVEQQQRRQHRAGGLGYFTSGICLAAFVLGAGLMVPIGRTEELSLSGLEKAAGEMGRRFIVALERLSAKAVATSEELVDAMATARVLLQCLASVLASYGEGVTKGWWRAKVAAFLADVSAAGDDRRRAMVAAGDGIVVDWLLETAAKSQGAGSAVTQGEAARALSFLLEDETTCESVLARPRAVPNLLRFSATLPANIRPQTYSQKKRLSALGSSRGISQLVTGIMEIVTASCDAGSDSNDAFVPKLPAAADLLDIAAALAVVEEGCLQLVEDTKNDDDDRGSSQGISMKLSGGTALLGMQVLEADAASRLFTSRDTLLQLPFMSGLQLETFDMVDRNQDTDLSSHGLWDDLQGRYVAVPLAAWALSTWAEASPANRASIVKLDKGGEALMAAVLAPERSVRWHGAKTMYLLLENVKAQPADEVVLQWSSTLLDLAAQACGHDDASLVELALMAFTSCFKNSKLSQLPGVDKAFPVMRNLAQQGADNARIQKAVSKAVESSIASGFKLSAEEAKHWCGTFLRWISSSRPDKGTQRAAAVVLPKVVETLGESSIPVSQTWLALLLLDLLNNGTKSPATASREAKAKGLLQTQVTQSAHQAVSNLGKIVSMEATSAQVPVADIAATIPLAGLLGAEHAPKNGTKEPAPKVSVADAASAVVKAVKALSELSAEDDALQQRIIDAGGLHLLRRLMLADDYERWLAKEAPIGPSSAADEKAALDVKKQASHIRKHAARLLTILSRHTGVSRAVANDKQWSSWLEDCAAGRLSGCNDLKSISYAKMVLLNISESQRLKEEGSVWPRYEDMIFLLSKGWRSQVSEAEKASVETVKEAVAGADGDDTSPLLDVVFIHGLAGGPIKTWRVTDDKTSTTGRGGLVERIDEQAGREGSCWPYEWLSNDLPRSRLISVKYKTNFSEWSGATLPLEEVSSMILDKLLAAGVGERPVVFIAHSMGGLVVKQMLLQAIKDKTRLRFADQTSGVVFYSCPHFGSRLANMPWRMGYVLRPAPSVAELRSGSPRLEELNRCIRGLHNRGSLQVLSFSETKVTPLVEGYGGWALRMEVVPIESAYPGFGELVVLDGTDHVNSCKPLSPSDPAYTKTLEFLRKIAAKHNVK